MGRDRTSGILGIDENNDFLLGMHIVALPDNEMVKALLDTFYTAQQFDWLLKTKNIQYICKDWKDHLTIEMFD